MTDSLPPPQGERFTLKSEEELRIEIRFRKASSCVLTLQQGSCELHGLELPLQKSITILDGGLQLPLFTWHGCVVDIDSDEPIDVSYVTDETNGNVAVVNTHAQLEALRDQATQAPERQGPRVLVCGPPESGKTSLCKTLVAYAAKVGRTPLWVDLDPADNALGVPGSLSVSAPVSIQDLSVEAYATAGLSVSCLHLWHGSTKLDVDLARAQITALGQKMDQRFAHDPESKASGIIVDTPHMSEELLWDTIEALSIDVVLVTGHDRLYSMMRNKVKQSGKQIFVIKLPRSGGAVSRDDDWMRHHRHRSLSRYFYGQASRDARQKLVHELTPFLNPLSFSSLSIQKFTNLTLSAALLPVAAQQTTQTVQLEQVADLNDIAVQSILAVCHGTQDLSTTGVAGFCAVEKVSPETDQLHLLCPCAGSLPSTTLLMGDIFWSD